MIFAITAGLVFAVVGIVGSFLVDLSHLGGNSRRPAMGDYLFVVIVAAILAVFAGVFVHHVVHLVLWIWSLL